MITHGLPSGFDQGCHTDVSCVNHRTKLMTCREASIRYRGDYAYRKQVDAGNPPLTKETFAKPERAKAPSAPKVTKMRGEVKPMPTKEKSTPRLPGSNPNPPHLQTKGVIGLDGYVHGTAHGYRRCKDPVDCPAIAAGLDSCLVVGRARHLAAFRRRHGIKPKRVAKHGTESGYVMFKCHDRATCPAIADGGISCGQAASDAGRARYQAKKLKTA